MVYTAADAAPKWARRYCEFSGVSPADVEKVVREKAGLKPICGGKVGDAYREYL